MTLFIIAIQYINNFVSGNVKMGGAMQVTPGPAHCQLAYLSGPSFAAEVAEGKPTGLTVAARVSLFVCGEFLSPSNSNSLPKICGFIEISQGECVVELLSKQHCDCFKTSCIHTPGCINTVRGLICVGHNTRK